MSGKSDNNISFSEAVYVLEKSGFVHFSGKGSHQVFRRSDGRIVVLPRHGKEIKAVYVKEIREALE